MAVTERVIAWSHAESRETRSMRKLNGIARDCAWANKLAGTGCGRSEHGACANGPFDPMRSPLAAAHCRVS